MLLPIRTEHPAFNINLSFGSAALDLFSWSVSLIVNEHTSVSFLRNPPQGRAKHSILHFNYELEYTALFSFLSSLMFFLFSSFSEVQLAKGNSGFSSFSVSAPSEWNIKVKEKPQHRIVIVIITPAFQYTLHALQFKTFPSRTCPST